MGVTQYVGARYVPIFADPAEWNKTRTYEPLTIVLHEGNSYTSKQFVPKGIDINNDDFWAETGNYNAQVEAYRKEVLYFDDRITKNENDIAEFTEQVNNDIEEIKTDVNNKINKIPIVTPEQVENSTLEKCIVTGITNDYTDNFTCLFEKIDFDMTLENDIERFCYKNKNGDILAPVFPTKSNTTNGCNPIPSILNAMSFLNKPNMHYKELNNKSVWFPSLVGNADSLVCSDLAMLYLNGTNYSTSAFAGVNNLPSKYTASLPKNFKSMANGEVIKNAWNTREFGYNAFTLGCYASSIDNSIDIIKPGDVIITKNDITHGLWRLNHCAIVVDTYPEIGFYLVLEAVSNVGGSSIGEWCITTNGGNDGDGVVMTYRNIKEKDGYIVFRPNFNPYNTFNTFKKNIVHDVTINTTAGTTNWQITDLNIPPLSILSLDIKHSDLLSLFRNNPDLYRINLFVDDYTGDTYGQRMMRYNFTRTQLTDPNEWFTDTLHISGYNVNRVNKIRVRAILSTYSDQPMSITLSNAFNELTAYSLESFTA